MPTHHEEEISSVKPIANARPRQKPTVTLTSVSILVLERRWIDIETQKTNDQECFVVSKAVTRLLRHDTQVLRGLDGAIHYDDIIDESRRKEFINAPCWSICQMDISSGKRWRRKGEKRRFQNCLIPNSLHRLLYFPAIQGHSAGVQTDLPSTSITSEMKLNWGQQLITLWVLEDKGLRTGRQAVFFTIVNPMDDQDGLGETLWRDLSQARIRAIQKIWKRASSTWSLLVQFEARSTKRTAFLSNKVKRCCLLGHTPCRVHGESDMHEDQGSVLSKGKRDSETACCSQS